MTGFFMKTHPERWRQPTLPFRVPLAREGLTAEFGMRSGVALRTNHQRSRCVFDVSKTEYMLKKVVVAK
jgi:hypothetical protein